MEFRQTKLKPQKRLMDLLVSNELDFITCCCVDTSMYRFKDSNEWFSFSSKNLATHLQKRLNRVTSHGYCPEIYDIVYNNILLMRDYRNGIR